ncbi:MULTISPECIES: DUF6597 domain-containing transcriptional factor [unclassified Sinorhizobium]|uniref:DUF6597 domain-containing transcriptional factor n=1 Tax=unclassified Sinorhizobium TaxID=2613772 RepID=UPI0035264157
MTEPMQDAALTPLLASRVGRYEEMLPPAALADHFRCAWIHEIGKTPTCDIAVVPDGCCDIIWTGGELMVVGPDRTAAFPMLSDGMRITGMRFHPGSAFSWLGLPLSEIVGRTLPLDDLWGKAARDIGQRVGECRSDRQRLFTLCHALEQRLVNARALPRETRVAFDLLSRQKETVAHLSKELGISERSLRRRCYEIFGYGPKTLERILRFQRFLALGQQSPETTLAALAIDTGYADQAHMTREVRLLSCLTPREILQQLQRPPLGNGAF